MGHACEADSSRRAELKLPAELCGRATTPSKYLCRHFPRKNRALATGRSRPSRTHTITDCASSTATPQPSQRWSQHHSAVHAASLLEPATTPSGQQLRRAGRAVAAAAVESRFARVGAGMHWTAGTVPTMPSAQALVAHTNFTNCVASPARIAYRALPCMHRSLARLDSPGPPTPHDA